ncbi:MAG: cytochrome c3 family protein [Deltaproteobacteria bacterium]|nr:cytochrome c3 family protein [Deltaproteobacteria bacterium]MBW2216144.1 cytochrome c3 family protein [Deltaproteobacteria bacterium]
MVNKVLGFLTVIFTAILFLAVGSLTAADVPDSVTMDSKIYPKHTKGLCTFSHKKHADHKDIGCADCHHVYTDGKNTWKEGDEVQKCEACHSEPAKPKGDKTKMSKAEKIKKYHKDALHANCKGCHKKMIDKTSELGKKIKKCTGCHPKKAK